jgi:hypothetical protein
MNRLCGMKHQLCCCCCCLSGRVFLWVQGNSHPHESGSRDQPDPFNTNSSRSSEVRNCQLSKSQEGKTVIRRANDHLFWRFQELGVQFMFVKMASELLVTKEALRPPAAKTGKRTDPGRCSTKTSPRTRRSTLLTTMPEAASPSLLRCKGSETFVAYIATPEFEPQSVIPRTICTRMTSNQRRGSAARPWLLTAKHKAILYGATMQGSVTGERVACTANYPRG